MTPTRLGSVIVIAKEPLPGRVKTRLSPPLSATAAAEVAAAALTDTLRTVAQVPARDHLLAFAGDPARWAPAIWRTCAQPDGGLDVRLAAAFASALPDLPAVLVGMDTPQLQVGHLTAFDPDTYDACLGLAADGGFWAIGFRDPAVAAAAIVGVPMSTSYTGAAQLQRLREAGLRVQLLDELTDVDTIDTAREVAASVPGSDFAHALERAVSTSVGAA